MGSVSAAMTTNSEMPLFKVLVAAETDAIISTLTQGRSDSEDSSC